MNIKKIRQFLTTKIGSSIVIIYYGSRNKKERYVGTILNTYNQVFTIRLVSGEIRCLSYIDVLIKTVQIYI